MPDTGSSFSNASVPFVLRGSSSVFSQRQMDTFGSLQALEDAHIKVTKATKAERLLVKKMTWRLAKPAVESLGAEKEAVSGLLDSIDSGLLSFLWKFAYSLDNFIRPL